MPKTEAGFLLTLQSCKRYGGKGSSVGEASARQTGHCPPASKDVWKGKPVTPGLRVSLTWLKSSDFLRRAVLKLGPVGQSVSALLSFHSPPERYMEPNDDKPPG